MAKQSNTINGMLTQFFDDDEIKFIPSDEFRNQAYFASHHQYKKIYRYSIENPEKFWSNTASELHWFKRWKKVRQGRVFNSKWFVGGRTNISYNCLDVHLNTERRNKAALIWESEDGETKIFTYQLLFTSVCNFAYALKELGVKKGDNIAIYMGLVPEAVIAMLACTRIGAIHSVIHNGVSVNALAGRIKNLKCELVITQDYILRKGSYIPIKEKVDKAIDENTDVKNVIVFQRYRGADIKLHPGRDIFWRKTISSAAIRCKAIPLDANHPAFSLFINGSNGKPVKILYRTGGYKVQAYLSSKWIYDLKDDDIFWVTNDNAWASSHAYSVYGPLLNGVTTFIYEGNPIHPHPDRFWELISKYRINIFCTTPTLLRAFLKLGDDLINKHDLSSLRLIGMMGETIKPDTWMWFYKSIGNENIPVINSWMQTETGSILISPMPGAAEMRPGLTSYPFPGVEIDIVDLHGNSVEEEQGGYLIINNSWPSMFAVKKEENPGTNLNCWNHFKGKYFSGDAAIREKNGFIRILGRVDDVIKTAGNRVAGSEIESILLNHKYINEAAVIKRPDEILGNAIIIYVSLVNNVNENLLLKEELRNYVAENIGSFAKPDELNFMKNLPKLKNGKINRRLLRKMTLEGTTKLRGKEEENFNILEKLREDYQKIYLR